MTGEIGRSLDALVEELDMVAEPPAEARRGGPLRSGGDEALVLRLVEEEGRLVVREGPATDEPMRGARRGGPADGGGQTAWQGELSKLDRSQVGEALTKLDRKLTPNQGLRELRGETFQPGADPIAGGRVLVWVHGTFSHNDNFLDTLKGTPAGRDLLGWASGHYDRVLAFDHPTLSVSPMINARNLALALGDAPAQVDVVCHSRGGLVTRWWLEAFDRGDPRTRRAVFVGAPLAGTGLAAPPNLKGSLGLLGNIASALGSGVAAVPFLAVMTGVFQVVSSVTKLAAKTPAIDAAVALVPGLAAQSRVGNNAELLSLRRSDAAPAGRYFAVRADFESEKHGWQFWKYFRRMGDRAVDALADCVFEGKNDLVVDTGSMTELSRELAFPPEQVYDFGTQDRVHHTNYFEQPETLAFIQSQLGGA